MNTFAKMWGIITPEQAAAKIEGQRRAAGITEPEKLEEQAISLIGTDVCETDQRLYGKAVGPEL